ncbi:hypothetical protein [Helicobacter brantae]|uniref:Uncharacterized protein n=1 Tax=Helicobacter brantae TaxID=375927 RepID=A0A3D8J081_9HELI|nr:hypothetical protein [Helicobacter brantae]RDU70565.1 hypothetical protein CQA58_05180 [Helicobacter brantae]
MINHSSQIPISWESGLSRNYTFSFANKLKNLNSMVLIGKQEATPREAPTRREEKNLGSESIGT